VWVLEVNHYKKCENIKTENLNGTGDFYRIIKNRYYEI
jgi:hypothetical protein